MRMTIMFLIGFVAAFALVNNGVKFGVFVSPLTVQKALSQK